MGDETAAALGVGAARLRRELFVVTAAVTGTVVAVSGAIGFVGLMVPHVVRMLVGADHRRVLAVAPLAGAVLLVWADVLSRLLFAPAELPVGVIIAVVGVAAFLLLMRRGGYAFGGALSMRPDIDDVTIEAAGTRLVEHIDLTVGSGAFVGLVGPNGSGKPALLRSLYRALRPAGGAVRLDGEDLYTMSPRAAARVLAALPQESSAEFDFTVAEVVAMGRLPHLVRTAASDWEICARAMARTGVAHLADRGFLSLSGGEKQRAISSSRPVAERLRRQARKDHLSRLRRPGRKPPEPVRDPAARFSRRWLNADPGFAAIRLYLHMTRSKLEGVAENNRPSSWHRIRTSMTRKEWASVGGMAAFILALHVIGWFTLVAIVAPEHYSLGTKTFGVGIGVTAYTLGMRHAFDADHIAAIDNTTRKLMNEGQRPLSVGFWFSLGHSSIVFALAFLLSLGVKSLASPVENDNSTLHSITGWIGTTVSGTFLYVIAIINLVIMAGIWKVFRHMRSGRFDEAALEERLNNRGFMNRLLGRVMKSITKPWQMYPLGLLFGLGFDTATEIALLVLAGSGAASGLPWYAILCLPVLFAAGMSLLDTVDGSFMNFAYGWAFSKPVRKVYYNLTITGLSVAVALIIGTVELLGLVAEKAGLHGPFWDWISGLDLNIIGYVIVALFFATWAVALLVWKVGRIEEKWTAGLARPAQAEPAAE